MVSNSLMAARVEETHLAVQTQKLEQAYQNSLHSISAIQGSEERRRLRLRLLLLENENEDLYDRMGQRDGSIKDLQDERDHLVEQFEGVSQSLRKAQDTIHAKTRQLNHLQREQEGLREKNSDSSKILTEKLALAHELSVLKPELEHVRSQLTSQQHAISEKQALQRQLRAAEVELENEKRATQKARVTSERSSSNDKHLQEMQNELDKEIEERQRAQAEAQEAAETFQQRKIALESQLDAFRTKLSKTKEQLAEAQKQLTEQGTKSTMVRIQEPETSSESESEQEPSPKPANKPKPKPQPKKRSFAEVELDASLGTPGDLPPTKRGKRAPSVQPGEKSSFSITPYLNRTGSVAPSSPDTSPSKPKEREIKRPSSTARSKKPVPSSPKTNSKPAAARPKSLGTAPAGRANAQPQAKRSTARSLSAPKLDHVPEDDENEDGEDNGSTERPPPSSQTAKPTKPSEQPLAKKKRIFLGKTIFDNDDEDAASRPQPVGVLSSKLALGSLVRTQSFKAPSLAAGRSVPTFGSFSPLKKDRKLAA